MLSKFLNNANKKKRGILQPSTDFTKRDSTHMVLQLCNLMCCLII